jgi:hypothetical protein
MRAGTVPRPTVTRVPTTSPDPATLTGDALSKNAGTATRQVHPTRSAGIVTPALVRSREALTTPYPRT